MDDEPGEAGVERNKTLTGVGTQLGRTISGLESAKSSFRSNLLRFLGIKFGFSKAAVGFGSGFDLVQRFFAFGASSNNISGEFS